MKSKQLIQELKKEIEKKEEKKQLLYAFKDVKGSDKKYEEEMKLKAQLQFAEKLIEAIKEDIEKLYCGRGIGLRVQNGILKILDEAVK